VSNSYPTRLSRQVLGFVFLSPSAAFPWSSKWAFLKPSVARIMRSAI
jgi:hypothetical protein